MVQTVPRIDVITIFEPMFDALRLYGVTARALQRGLANLHCWNPRDFVQTQYKSVDDRPYGGGPGMVMMAQPLADCLHHARAQGASGPVIYLSPQGNPLKQVMVNDFAKSQSIILLCGRYEGIDERFLSRYVDQEICVGEFVVSGGELPAMMLIDALIRRIPGALNHTDSAEQDSFMQGLLDHPHYTRPEVFDGESIPEILNSGHHANIAQWRRQQALLATSKKRPDLLANKDVQQSLTRDDVKFLKGILK